jgi:hypothetical protein
MSQNLSAFVDPGIYLNFLIKRASNFKKIFCLQTDLNFALGSYYEGTKLYILVGKRIPA